MKVPTADYSPLSQALSAVSSAKQASWSVKDASNWQNRYQIQQKSFDLQDQSYDLQQEAIDSGRFYNGVNLGLNVASIALETAEKIYNIKREEMGQEATNNATNLTTDFKAQLDLNEDYTQIIENEDGSLSVGLSDKGLAAWNKTKEKYFPSGEKYGWGMDDTVSNLVDSTYASLNSYGSELAVSRVQQNTELAYSNNMSHALEFDLQSGEVATFDVDDGAGGTRTITVGAQQARVINSRASSMGPEWAQNQLIAASDQRRVALGNNIIADISKKYADGSYILDANAWSLSDAQIDEYLNTIMDPTDRLEAEENIKAAKSSAITSYFEDKQSSILSQDRDSYKALDTLYKEVTDKDGNTYKFFTESKYIEPSTYTSVRSSIKSSMDTIESAAGTVNTNAVQNGFKTYNAQFRAGQISGKDYAVKVDNLMATTYCNDDGTPNYNWRENPEALQVYQTQIEELLPDNVASDDSFKTSWNIAWQTALNVGDGTLYKDLTPEKQEYANLIKSDMLKEITEAVLTDPSVAIDPKAYADALKDISRRYNAKWIDYINSDVGKAGLVDTVTGKDAVDMARKSVDELIKADSTGILNSITPNGYLDRTGDPFLPGVNDRINETITLIGTYGRDVEGLNIEPNTGTLKFKMDENGSPSIDKKGNPILESVEWNNIILPNGERGTVSYSVESDEWIYEGRVSKKMSSDAEYKAERIQEGIVTSQESGKVPESMQVKNQAVELSDRSLKEVDTFLNKTERVTTEDEETGNEVVEEVSAVDETDIRDFIGTHAKTEAEVSAYIDEFKDRHANGEVMTDISDEEFDKLMESIRYSFKNIKVDDSKSSRLQLKDNHVRVSYGADKNASQSESDNTSTYTKWVNNHQSAGPGEVYQYLKSLDDSELEQAIEEMKEQVDGAGFLKEKFNDPKRALDNYLKKIREERNNK